MMVTYKQTFHFYLPPAPSIQEEKDEKLSSYPQYIDIIVLM